MKHPVFLVLISLVLLFIGISYDINLLFGIACAALSLALFLLFTILGYSISGPFSIPAGCTAMTTIGIAIISQIFSGGVKA